MNARSYIDFYHANLKLGTGLFACLDPLYRTELFSAVLGGRTHPALPVLGYGRAKIVVISNWITSSVKYILAFTGIRRARPLNLVCMLEVLFEDGTLGLN